jgi:UDP-N-acetyl-D-mannosaminuronic acid dehydrogenase
MNVAVIGLGYIGLPTAALLAQNGHEVYGYDIDAQLRHELRERNVHIAEAAVKNLVEEALATGRLHIVDEVPQAEAYIICVPTPARDGRAVLTYVEAAAAAVAAAAPRGAMIVLESTVPPGTTERVIERALRDAGKPVEDYCVAHCPERVIPGAIVEELRGNDRIVGGRTPEEAQRVADLYASFCRGQISPTTTGVAEFVKIVENTYRDVNIAFANELAVFAEHLGVDVWETIALANRHPRVNILNPGPGVGGHCIPVDPHFLADANPWLTELIQSARRVNERMPYHVAQRIEAAVGAPRGQKIALLGAAYKADVDDARESPALRVEALLRERGFQTAIYDPHVRRLSHPLCSTLEEALKDADAIVLITPHAAFKAIVASEAGALMRGRRLIDTRGFFDQAEWQRSGFECYVLGRGGLKRAARAVA